MYGVPANLDVAIFVGATLVQVCFGEFQVQFNFDPFRSIAVEGRWQIFAPDGQLTYDGGMGTASEQSVAQMLLGRKIVSGSVRAPDWFDLLFETA
jgi:hypothetical protein